MAWDKNDCTNRTNIYKDSFLSKADRLRKDPDDAERHLDLECPFCHYCRYDQIAGQAFTKFTCAICGQEKLHGNTAVPKLCTKCAAENDACQVCGADMELEIAVPSTLPKPTIRNKKMKAHIPGKSPTVIKKAKKRRTTRGR